MGIQSTDKVLNDMLDNIYDQLVKNKTIAKYCVDDDRIKFYEIPETMEADGKPLIIIDPLSSPVPTNFGSNEELSYEFTYQIDVQSNDRKLTKLLQNEVYQQMKLIDFYILRGGLDEYFEQTKRFVDARRYRGRSRIYETNY